MAGTRLGPCVSLTAAASLRGRYKKVPNGPREVEAYVGIPYANPTGRYKAPEPLTLWTGERDATKYGAICPQNFTFVKQESTFPLRPPTNVSEDCLFLNVWTPSSDQRAAMPVMAFIHGGAFTHGFSNLYQGTSLASFHDVVFVSINYRLASFGFLCTGSEDAPGNYGLLDQIEALRWINRYIKKFGGDPDNVTIIGESAGAMSVSWLVISPLARGLFRRAVSQSGSALCPAFTWTPQQAANYLSKKLAEIGCENVQEPSAMLNFLHSKDAKELSEILGEGFRPVVDNYVIPDFAEPLLANGQFNQDVDYMMGFNSHEGAMFTMVMSQAINVDDISTTQKIVRGFLKTNFRGYDLEKLFNLAWKEYFPERKYGQKSEVLSRMCEMFGDMLLSSPTEHLAAMHAAKAKGRVFLYHFTRRPDFSPYPPWIKADHAMEIMFMMGTILGNLPFLEFSEEDKQLSHIMMKYWVNFARNGNPNGDGLVQWPEYNTTSKQCLTLDTLPTVVDHVKQHRFEFWQTVVPTQCRQSAKL